MNEFLSRLSEKGKREIAEAEAVDIEARNILERERIEQLEKLLPRDRDFQTWYFVVNYFWKAVRYGEHSPIGEVVYYIVKLAEILKLRGYLGYFKELIRSYENSEHPQFDAQPLTVFHMFAVGVLQEASEADASRTSIRKLLYSARNDFPQIACDENSLQTAIWDLFDFVYDEAESAFLAAAIKNPMLRRNVQFLVWRNERVSQSKILKKWNLETSHADSKLKANDQGIDIVKKGIRAATEYCDASKIVPEELLQILVKESILRCYLQFLV